MDAQHSGSGALQPDPARFEARARDWRCGPLVYQIFVDRFAPSADLEAKRHLYAAPRRLRQWHEPPGRGRYKRSAEVWSHELDFWGGDLRSVARELDYVQGLGAEVVYLNPIHSALTNHKYDAHDLAEIAPEYGTHDDLAALAEALHARGMHLVLDGVFNHVGRSCAWFQEALADPTSPKRGWFTFDEALPEGYVCWQNVKNLPELNLEHPEVQARIFGEPDAVVETLLRLGVDGLRLDVAFDLGPEVLARLVEATHRAKPGSCVVGELWNYPAGWAPPLDGVLNFFAWRVLTGLVAGQVSGPRAGRMLTQMVDDMGVEAALRSWLILDNHDMARLKTALPERWQRRMAQALQMTLPGAPCLYYGTELGMRGGADPEQRAAMAWHEVGPHNADLAFVKQLIEVRRQARALRVGDLRALDTERLLGFLRLTDRADETRVVLVNPTDQAVEELVPLTDGRLMNETPLSDALSGARTICMAGTMWAKLPPHGVQIWGPVVDRSRGYSSYKRVR